MLSRAERRAQGESLRDHVPLSAFAFLRGSATVMASDLSLLPTSGIITLTLSAR